MALSARRGLPGPLEICLDLGEDFLPGIPATHGHIYSAYTLANQPADFHQLAANRLALGPGQFGPGQADPPELANRTIRLKIVYK